jgi:hypothetical protein
MKLKKIILSLMTVVALVCGVMGLTACGDSGATQAKITETYIGKHVVTTEGTTEYNGETITYTTNTNYYEQLQLLDDGTYIMTQTQASDSTNYVVYAKGTYTKNAKNAKYDGYTEVVLADATYVQVNQDIYNHMFSLTIDSESSTFPHEVAGGAQLEKVDFLAMYGKLGSRFIRHQVTITDTAVENWIDIESDVVVVE